MFSALLFVLLVGLLVYYFVRYGTTKRSTLKVTVREVLLNDDDVAEMIQASSELLKKTFGEGCGTIQTENNLAMLWANKGALYVATVTEDGEEKVVGSIQFEAKWVHLFGPDKDQKLPGKPNIFFANLAVDEKYRMKGVCTQLVQCLIDEGWDRRSTFSEIIVAEVAKDNARVLDLYKRIGLKVVEETETRNLYDCVAFYGVDFRKPKPQTKKP